MQSHTEILSSRWALCMLLSQCYTVPATRWTSRSTYRLLRYIPVKPSYRQFKLQCWLCYHTAFLETESHSGRGWSRELRLFPATTSRFNWLFCLASQKCGLPDFTTMPGQFCHFSEGGVSPFCPELVSNLWAQAITPPRHKVLGLQAWATAWPLYFGLGLSVPHLVCSNHHYNMLQYGYNNNTKTLCIKIKLLWNLSFSSCTQFIHWIVRTWGHQNCDLYIFMSVPLTNIAIFKYIILVGGFGWVSSTQFLGKLMVIHSILKLY